MKKILILMAAAVMLVSCGRNVNTDTDTPDSEPAFSGETLPFQTAKNGYYSDGRLYYSDNSFVRYINLSTGEDRVLCYDPLCSHDNETVTADCECIAYCAEDGFTGRVLAEDGRVWFLASEPASMLPGDFTTYYQLRCIDLDDMSLSVYLRTNEMHIYDFWMYSGEIYLSMPRQETDENGRISYMGGSIYRMEKSGKLTMVLEDTDSDQLQLLASGEGCVYYNAKFGSGELYRAESDFSGSEAVLTLNGVYNIRISGDYVYYMKKTGNSYRLQCEPVDRDFDAEVSYTELAGNEYGLYRMNLSDLTEETVYASMPQVRSNTVLNYCTYQIDEPGGLIWLTPLDPAYIGYGIWDPDFWMMQMGAGGKSVLTGIFSETNGRILALDMNTLEPAAEYSIPGWDVLDIYAVENGRVMGLFRMTDAEKLNGIHETDGLNSRWEYDAYGAFALE